MKLFTKIAMAAVGAVMAIGSGVAAINLSSASGSKEVNAADTTITSTVNELVTANSWTLSAGSTIGTKATSFTLDSVISVSTTASGNNGTIWGTTTNDWRLYQTANGDVTISAASGYSISSITLVFSVAKTGQLAGVTSGTAFSVGASSWNCAVTNSGTATNGQVKITSFSVTYASTGLSVTSIAVAGTPATQYIGYVFDSTGLTVTATWSDLTTSDVSALSTWSITSALTSTDTSIYAIYSEKNSDPITIAPVAETAAPAIIDSTVDAINALSVSNFGQLYRVSGLAMDIVQDQNRGQFYIQDANGHKLYVYGAEDSSASMKWDGRPSSLSYTFTNGFTFIADYITSNALQATDTVTFVGYISIYGTTVEIIGYFESIVKNTSTTVTYIDVTGTSSVAIGATVTLSATVLPSTATDKTVTWSSSNAAVASVDGTGVVTGVAEGSAVITATANDGSGIKDTYSIKVPAPLAATYEKVTSADSLINNAKVVIAIADGTASLSTTQNTNGYRDTVASTVSGDALTPNAGIAALKISKNTTVVSDSTLYTLYDAANAGYLYGTTSNNDLKTTSSLFHNVGGSSTYWSISIDATSYVATITNAGTSKSIKYNTGSPRFSSYASGQTDVLLWIDTANSTAAAEANTYASSFLTQMRASCDETGATYDAQDVGQAWSSLESSYGLLSSSAKTIILNASAIADSGNDVEAMLYSYDYICGKYGPNGTNDVTDFLGRNPSGSRVINAFNNNNSSMLIILVISMSSLVTLGGFILFKKKKESK